MVEVVIGTGHLRVERIAWDPHNPYTLALTSNATHFEMWTIPVVDKCVHPPRLTLRPPEHDERSTTRGVAFSPSDPNLIIVIVEAGNAGKVIIYDRRHVEVLRSLETTGPCLAVAFHPTFCDLLAVCYRKAKTKTDSRVQFFRVLSEVSLMAQKPTAGMGNNNNNKNYSSTGGSNSYLAKLRDGAPLVEQDMVPPIDSVDSLHRLRWRPCVVGTAAVVGDASVDVNDVGGIDAISSQLWFATTALNGQEISVWDAANGFSPVFSIKSVCNGREPTQRERTLREPTDCVWVNALTLVSVFKDGKVILTCLLDEPTASKDMLFRGGGIPNTATVGVEEESDVFSLGAILPTAAVVADYFGRSFVTRNTTSHLREYYTKIINAEKSEMLEQLSAREASCSNSNNHSNTVAGGIGAFGLSTSSSPVAAKHYRESTRMTPVSGATFDARHTPMPQTSVTQTPLHISPFCPRGLSSVSTLSLAGGSVTAGGRRLESLFSLLSSLVANGDTEAETDSKGLEGVGQRCTTAIAGAAPPPQIPSLSSSLPASRAIAVAPRRQNSRCGLDVQSENSQDEKAWTFLTRCSGAAAALVSATTTTRAESHRASSAPTDVHLFGEFSGGLARSTAALPAVAGGATVTSPISLAPSDDEVIRRPTSHMVVGRKGTSVSETSLHEVPLPGTTPPFKDGGRGATAKGASPPLALRSLVNPVIERFALSDGVCGWAYVERSSEQETFVRYATQWEVGYDVARQMRAVRHAAAAAAAVVSPPVFVEEEDTAVVNTYEVDRRFARMMAHNAKVCEVREREMQKRNGVGSMSAGSSVTKASNGRRERRGTGGGAMASVDPRGQLWAAAAQALHSHNITLITSIVRSQLDYASLVGDVQYCAVLYLLFCLWWKQRHVYMDRYPCPLLPHDDSTTSNTPGGAMCNGASSDDTCTPRQWRLRALQWVEQYVSRLYARELYVPLNELLLIVPDVMGGSSPGLPRAEDFAQKLFTCVYCGMCPKAELVPRPPKDSKLLLASRPTTPVLPRDVSGGEDAHGSSADEESGSICAGSLSSSTSSSEGGRGLPAAGGSADEAEAEGKVKWNADGVIPLAGGLGLRNAVCRRCRSTTLMTCVICEEVVEGMYLWLRSCGHGGHVHHVKEWLQVSGECPRCGVPILPPEEANEDV